ncbi:hypothetical protein [Methylobrevis pamukkalensis]|uniref:AsmA-like C-terminal domain-containing protein n=1 Tax=Methylobrevis pamukkalensis TaxID=1439726 RepID=A0A1E3H3I8_9HYPH|nr:hypothetical protein [Methylobrevis pamukkalensis]ODN70715.1 hypothetical protein A6302_01935 [Methylobrevis pamukkalensis]
MRLSAEILPADRPLSVTVDGKLSVEGSVPNYAGTMALTRVMPAEPGDIQPFHVTAAFDLDPYRFLLKDGEFRYGPEDRPFVVTGAANVTFADAPFFDAVLSSRQIDVDRTLGGGASSPVAFADALDGFAAALSALPRPRIPGQIGFDIPGIVIGGDLIQDVRFDASTRDNGWRIDQFEARLPGQSELAATGEIKTGGADTAGSPLGGLAFTGHAALASRQRPRSFPGGGRAATPGDCRPSRWPPTSRPRARGSRCATLPRPSARPRFPAPSTTRRRPARAGPTSPPISTPASSTLARCARSRRWSPATTRQRALPRPTSP